MPRLHQGSMDRHAPAERSTADGADRSASVVPFYLNFYEFAEIHHDLDIKLQLLDICHQAQPASTSTPVLLPTRRRGSLLFPTMDRHAITRYRGLPGSTSGARKPLEGTPF